MLRTIGIVIASLAVAPLAQAADNGIYLGAGYTHSEFGLDFPDAAPLDDEDNGFKLIAGWRPLDNFGVEVNYIDHGEAVLPSGIVCIALVGVPCPDTTHVGAETLSGFAVGYIDFPVIDLFAKAGVTSWKIDGRSGPGFNFDDDDFDFAWGAGIQARFGSFGARFEYERFSVIEDRELETISLSFTYTFF